MNVKLGFELRARRRPNREEKGDLVEPDRRARRPQGPMAQSPRLKRFPGAAYGAKGEIASQRNRSERAMIANVAQGKSPREPGVRVTA